MSSFSLTDETAIDVLIFWIESSDGAISYAEQKAVKRVLSNMEYTMKTFHQTMSHLGALSTEDLVAVEKEALEYVKKNFSDDGKKLTYSLLDAIAHCDGSPTSAEQEKLNKVKTELSV